MALLTGYGKRWMILFKVQRYDYIFIHREASPIGPPIFEWIIGKLLKKKIIYDFDDAIWMTDNINEPPIQRILKWRVKVASICAWSYRVSCGNAYLCDYARQFCQRVVFNPTTIDTENWHNRSLYEVRKPHKEVIIGWTGSHSTVKYLKIIEPVLQQIESEHSQVRFVFIADKKPDLNLKTSVFIPWKHDTEIEDLLTFDIGLMPLPDDEWSKGKCGFKVLQYMSLGIPSVASPVGVNPDIIIQGVDGYLANSLDEWLTALRLLIADADLRERVGAQGKDKVRNHYSVSSNSSNFLSLFD